MKFSYEALCHSVQLTPSLKEFFEERLGALTAARYCEFKAVRILFVYTAKYRLKYFCKKSCGVQDSVMTRNESKVNQSKLLYNLC